MFGYAVLIVIAIPQVLGASNSSTASPQNGQVLKGFAFRKLKKFTFSAISLVLLVVATWGWSQMKGSDTSLVALNGFHLLQSGQLVDLSSVPTLTTSILDLTARLLDELGTTVENSGLTQLTGTLGFLLKVLLTPIIVLVDILLYVVEILLRVLLTGLSNFLIFPLLNLLGLGSLDGAIGDLANLIYTVLDGLICILSKLSFIQLFSRCEQVRMRESS